MRPRVADGHTTAMNTKDLVRVRHLAVTGAARALREAAGLSLADVAEPIGVDRSTVWRWERGLRRPHGEPARRYLELLTELSR